MYVIFSSVSTFEDGQQIVVVVLVVVVEPTIVHVHAVVGIVLGRAPPITACDVAGADTEYGGSELVDLVTQQTEGINLCEGRREALAHYAVWH